MTNQHSFVSSGRLDGDLYTSSKTAERVLNAAIVQAEITESFEEHLEIFDAFYADTLGLAPRKEISDVVPAAEPPSVQKSIDRYLDQIKTLKEPTTHRKYDAPSSHRALSRRNRRNKGEAIDMQYLVQMKLVAQGRPTSPEAEIRLIGNYILPSNRSRTRPSSLFIAPMQRFGRAANRTYWEIIAPARSP